MTLILLNVVWLVDLVMWRHLPAAAARCGFFQSFNMFLVNNCLVMEFGMVTSFKQQPGGIVQLIVWVFLLEVWTELVLFPSVLSAWRLRSKSPRRNSQRVLIRPTCTCSHRCPACRAPPQNLRWCYSSVSNYKCGASHLLVHFNMSTSLNFWILLRWYYWSLSFFKGVYFLCWNSLRWYYSYVNISNGGQLDTGVI